MEMRNGSAAAVDGMNAELLKNAPEELIEEVWRIITEVWMTNKVPREWSKTVQILIPKAGRPTGTDDYRRRRKENVAERIKKAYKAMRVILPFVKRTRLPWRLTLRLYSTVIAPVVLYGIPETYLSDEEQQTGA
jgi:hypothetical protein